MYPKIKNSGRPKIENPKIKQYRLRLTEEDFQKLEYVASRKKEAMSDVLRKGVEIQYEILKDIE